MHFSLRFGETTEIIHPVTGEPVTVIVTAIADGRVMIQMVATSDMPVSRVREELPGALH